MGPGVRGAASWSPRTGKMLHPGNLHSVCKSLQPGRLNQGTLVQFRLAGCSWQCCFQGLWPSAALTSPGDPYLLMGGIHSWPDTSDWFMLLILRVYSAVRLGHCASVCVVWRSRRIPISSLLLSLLLWLFLWGAIHALSALLSPLWKCSRLLCCTSILFIPLRA